MTNNTNDLIGAFIAGIAFSAIVIAIFQIGINIGINTSVDILEEYPAAKQFLRKQKKVARMLPYVIGHSND